MDPVQAGGGKRVLVLAVLLPVLLVALVGTWSRSDVAGLLGGLLVTLVCFGRALRPPARVFVAGALLAVLLVMRPAVNRALGVKKGGDASADPDGLDALTGPDGAQAALAALGGAEA